jgi:hypothetical protein
MRMIKSLAEFKRRLLPGSKWLLTNTLTMNQFVRVVNRRQDNAVVFDTDRDKESWLYYPRAKDCVAEGQTLKIKMGDGHYLVYYQLAKPPCKDYLEGCPF